MDGRLPRIDHTSGPSWFRSFVCRHRVLLRAAPLMLCVGGIAENQSDAADRFSLFRRQNSATRPADRTSNPSRTESTRSEVLPTAAIDSTSALPPSPAKGIADKDQTGLVPSSTLKRFPQQQIAASSESATDRPINLEEDVTPIDLPAALRLAGYNSPQVLVAQQRMLAAAARQQLAAAQILPNLNIGMNYNEHTGALQRGSGSILDVQRSSLYIGGGTNAIGAGTVNIPGLQYNLNVGEAYFGYLVSRQLAASSQFGTQATQNNTLLQLATAYCQLVQAQGARAIAIQIRDDAAEIARITASFAKVGQGRPADAERAAAELARREADILATQVAVVEASARIGQLLNLESSVQLQSNENWAVPRAIVPDLIPLPELIAISLYQRPELSDRRAQVHAAMLQLQSAKMLLFSPQVIAGLSDGAFGGGSDVNAALTGKSQFGNFANRVDADLIMYWSVRNMGCANRALVKAATARLAATSWEQTQQLNDIRAEVADAFARTQASAAQLDIRQQAVLSSQQGYRADLERARAGEGRPIEVLDSLRLLAMSQRDYLDTITGYNQAHYALYVAIGQPPADLLARPAIENESSENLPEPE
ncbi:TolC family protein [Schlesneria paludicola]|uniref:TolC family protein n=1 Tax=Schlesneria paludicola TaxID=360056 RepID=UPI00029AB163|nr:TolC family protein [Schlesneria paludicola]